MSGRVFLLSPANCGGRRAKQALSPKASFALAEQLRSRRGAALGDLFAFVSGLYFRGKLTYARHFAAPPDTDLVEAGSAGCGVQIITPNAGLRTPDTFVTRDAVLGFAGEDVHQDNAACRVTRAQRACPRAKSAPTATWCSSAASRRRNTSTSSSDLRHACTSIDFVGRGDMSRGGLSSAAREDATLLRADRRRRPHGARPKLRSPGPERVVPLRIARPGRRGPRSDRKEVRLTNLRKIFWTELSLSKGDLLRCYADVADVLIPRARPRMVMKRYPHGAAGDASS